MITGFYASILALILIGLIFNVIRLRMHFKVGLGDGGIKQLEQAIRVHGNFVENVPFLLILLFLMETAQFYGWFLHVFGILIITSRLLHAYGLSQSPYRTFGRMAGMITNQALFITSSLLLIINYFHNFIN